MGVRRVARLAPGASWSLSVRRSSAHELQPEAPVQVSSPTAYLTSRSLRRLSDPPWPRLLTGSSHQLWKVNSSWSLTLWSSTCQFSALPLNPDNPPSSPDAAIILTGQMRGLRGRGTEQQLVSQPRQEMPASRSSPLGSSTNNRTRNPRRASKTHAEKECPGRSRLPVGAHARLFVAESLLSPWQPRAVEEGLAWLIRPRAPAGGCCRLRDGQEGPAWLRVGSGSPEPRRINVRNADSRACPRNRAEVTAQRWPRSPSLYLCV